MLLDKTICIIRNRQKSTDIAHITFTQSGQTELLDNKKATTEKCRIQLKEDRPFRIIIKNLHPITDPKKIAQELKAIGHETSKLPYNIKHKATKQPLSIFFFNLLLKSNNKEIYSLDNS
ncbi:Nucleic-acid-binding protein from transposon X-element [Vespula squamosa]|uniref:Nucleic-acid-binding protein from transposon X-element n=1 Tax=Vespula squamosa TaxID=30214 RepID=A0ABD2BAH4_VESSQ